MAKRPRVKSKRTARPRDDGARTGGVPTKQEVLEFIAGSQEKVGKREIAKAFSIKGGDRRALKDLLNEMAAEGLLVGNRKDFRQPGHLPPVTVLEVKEIDHEGDLVAEPVTWNVDEGLRPRAIVLDSRTGRLDRGNRADTLPPGPGDRILAKLTRLDEPSPAGALYEAAVIRRLPREKRRMLGIYRDRGSRGGSIDPIDRKALKEWTVVRGDDGGAKDGDLVRFDTVRSGHRHTTARVDEVLGNPDEQQKISLIAIHAHGLPDEFPEPVLEELRDLAPPSLDGRTDLRDLPLLTIDPADARDHDDAVHAAPDPDAGNSGGWIVSVAIADVAHYVRPNSRLDREAQLRANSIYFPDRVVPMLPERISNDLCSLRPNEDRPCLVAQMTFDRSGSKKGQKFLRAMMRSHAKLSYEEAQAAFDGYPGDAAQPFMTTALEPLWQAYQALKTARDKRQPLDLDLPEKRLRLDAEGNVAGITVPERLEAHRLIEEFMIQANVAAAEALEKAKSPVVYRVHDQPSKDKIKGLADFLETLDLKLPQASTLKPQHFNGILAAAQKLPVPELVSEVVLRSQAQAEYATDNYGHFGLNLKRYAHFTSPIRRYADLLVHRALIEGLKLGDGGLPAEQAAELPTIAEAISQTERRTMAAERETTERLIAGFLSEHVGVEFSARISGMTSSGLFVRLSETGADGYVPASSLDDDYYHYVEDQHALVGDRHGRAYRLGDVVDVRLIEAVPMAGALRFEMLSEGKTGHISLAKGWRNKRPSGRRRGHRRR
ncbi:MAG: ribonuclease R [Hyphomicrobiaceae bacterium]